MSVLRSQARHVTHAMLLFASQHPPSQPVEDVRETFEDIHDVAKDTSNNIKEGLGKAKDRIEDVTDAISDKVEDLVDDVQEVLGISKVEDKVQDWIAKTAMARRVSYRFHKPDQDQRYHE